MKATLLRPHFPGRPPAGTPVIQIPLPPDVEPDDLTRGLDGMDGCRGIVNGALLATIFWLALAAWWVTR